MRVAEIGQCGTRSLAGALAFLMAACGAPSCPAGMIAAGGGCAPFDGGSRGDGEAPCTPADETCDGADQDCDGRIDESFPKLALHRDQDGDGAGENPPLVACAREGLVARGGDCDDRDPSIGPGRTEDCDGVDQDCDGSYDEGTGALADFYPDGDGDGHADPAGSTVRACLAPIGRALVADDCDDAAANIHPGASEHCNGLDDDCDGTHDESLQRLIGDPIAVRDRDAAESAVAIAALEEGRYLVAYQPSGGPFELAVIDSMGEIVSGRAAVIAPGRAVNAITLRTLAPERALLAISAGSGSDTPSVEAYVVSVGADIALGPPITVASSADALAQTVEAVIEGDRVTLAWVTPFATVAARSYDLALGAPSSPATLFSGASARGARLVPIAGSPPYLVLGVRGRAVGDSDAIYLDRVTDGLSIEGRRVRIEGGPAFALGTVPGSAARPDLIVAVGQPKAFQIHRIAVGEPGTALGAPTTMTIDGMTARTWALRPSAAGLDLLATRMGSPMTLAHSMFERAGPTSPEIFGEAQFIAGAEIARASSRQGMILWSSRPTASGQASLWAQRIGCQEATP